MSRVEIIDLRDQLPWNPNRPRWPQQRDIESIDRVILHQELGNADVEAVNAYHISPECHVSPGRGAPRICYHYCIRKNGEIIQCNGLEDVVWHCRGQNTHSIGIMLVGDFEGPGHNGGEPKGAQERTFFILADHLMATLQLSTTSFYGHAAFGKLACPGYTAYSWIERLRE